MLNTYNLTLVITPVTCLFDSTFSPQTMTRLILRRVHCHVFKQTLVRTWNIYYPPAVLSFLSLAIFLTIYCR